MGGNVLKKLRSSKGASLTFALLAFLVCAVISAVLLASASAASGRVSKLAETDQRYYAVTSAAQLFCDALENQQFTIKRMKTTKDVTQVRYMEVEGITFQETMIGDPDLSVIPSGVSLQGTLYELSMTIPDTPEASHIDSTMTDTKKEIGDLRDISIFADAALSYTIGISENTDVKDAYDNSPGSAGGAANTPIKSWDLKLDFDKATAESTYSYTGIQLKATATLRNDGSMIIEFRNDSPDQAFKVTVTLMATITDTSALPEVTTTEDTYLKFNVLETEGEESVLYDYETTITTTTETKTTTISWGVTEIKKGAA